MNRLRLIIVRSSRAPLPCAQPIGGDVRHMSPAERIDVLLGRSRAACALIVFAHAVALAASLLALQGFPALGVVALVVFSAVRTLRLHGLRVAGGAVCRVRLHPQGDVEIFRRDERVERARIDARSTVYASLVVMRLTGSPWQGGRAVIVPRDCVPAEVHRQLRVWMRWTAAAAQDDRPNLS